jgi:chemotaxis methyl-accepting protein methylase
MLEQKPESLPRAVSAVLIGVSEFFRDRAVFDHLRDVVLPELLKGRRELRVYSAGCSDGQEPYSIAMLLDDLGALERSCLLGVDCRSEAIARAEAGWFRAAELQGIEPQWRERYFRSQGAHALVSPVLRARMQWRAGDVAACGEGAGWDVILFRNLAIYFKPDRAAAVWERLARQLAPGGVLVTGKAERPPAGLPLRRVSSCIYQKPED